MNSIEKVGDEIRAVADEHSVWATTCGEQHAIQTRVKEMERQQRRQRQRIFDVEDEIADKRELQQLQEQESDRSLVLPPEAPRQQRSPAA